MSLLPAPRLIRLAPQVHDGRSETPISLSVHEQGEGPAVVLCHGFPELAYSWRHQIAPIAEAGFRVIVPNMRGYGTSDAPEGIESYDIRHLCGDLVGLLDALEIEKAVFAGHDWGGFVVWAMPILHPDRTAGVIGVNTPYTPRSAVAPTEMMRMLVGGQDEKMYILWFQTPGVAEDVLERNPRILFEKLMRRPMSPQQMQARAAAGDFDMNPFRRLEEIETLGASLLDDQDLDAYVQGFAQNGFRGPVSWYRNFDRNWETNPRIGVDKPEVPCLMVTAEWDPVLSPAMAAGMPNLVPDLEMVMIEECGHWTQQEKPDELNEIMVGWLRRRHAGS